MALRPKNVNGAGRREWNDYSAPRRVYLLTLDAAEGAAEWSEVVARTDVETVKAVSALTYEGSEVEAGLQQMRREFDGVKVLEYMVMPEHLHVVVCGGGTSETWLEEWVMALKREVSARILGQECTESVFAPGMHHRVLRPHDAAHLERMFGFVRSNPERRLMRQRHGTFRRRGKVTTDEGETLDCFGNPDLLMDPEIEAVKISHTFTPEQLQRHQTHWRRTVENGGVLVSPFISAAEQRVRDEAARSGGRLIVVLHEGIGPNFTVDASYLPLLDEGRLLVIGANEYPPEKPYASRADCMRMNEIAAMVAAGRVR